MAKDRACLQILDDFSLTTLSAFTCQSHRTGTRCTCVMIGVRFRIQQVAMPRFWRSKETLWGSMQSNECPRRAWSFCWWPEMSLAGTREHFVITSVDEIMMYVHGPYTCQINARFHLLSKGIVSKQVLPGILLSAQLPPQSLRSEQ